MKTRYKTILSLLMIHVFASITFAQNSGFLQVSGLYRMDGNINSLNGKIIENDTVSQKRNSTGYALADLALTINPFKELKVTSILRARTYTGDFFGMENQLLFRQIRAEGNLAKIIKYEIGDIDVEMTKYTIFNNQEIYDRYESEAFQVRRQIVSYENFNVGNAWRLQGAKFATAIKFNKILNRIQIEANANRVRKSNINTIPDRYILAGRLGVIQSKFVKFGFNTVNLSDDVGSSLDTAFNYSNNVITSDYQISIPVNNFEFGLNGEVGNSHFRYSLATPINKDTYSDFFYDLGIVFKYLPNGLKLFGNYREVGGKYSSPTAQTLRLNQFAQGRNLGLYNFGNNIRSLSLLDRMSDYTIYNQSISATLMDYNPVFGNILPYGQATPNRKGIDAGVVLDDTASFINFSYQYSSLSEVTPEGTDQLRSFNAHTGGVKLNIGKLLSTNRLINVKSGFRLESTKRLGDAPIKFENNLLDVGIEFETINKIDVVCGYKLINAKGNELLSKRDVFNNIKSFTTFEANINQSILSYGLKVRFFENSYFALIYNKLNTKDTVNSNLDYSYNQFWGNLSIFF